MNPSFKKPLPLLILLSLFTVTFFLYRDFDIRMILGFGVLGLILLWQLAVCILERCPLELDSVRGAMLWLAAVVTLSFLRPDSQHSADTVSYIISMLICTGFVWLWQENHRESRLCLNVLFAAGMAMTAFVLACRIFPEQSYAFLYPRLSGVAQRYFDYFLPHGYGMALGGYTFTDYVIFCGIAVCWAKIISARQRSWRDLLWLALIFLSGFAILTVGRRGELLVAAVLCAGMVLLLCRPRTRILLVLGGGGAIALFLWFFIKNLAMFKEIDIFYRYARSIENLLCGYDITSGRTGLYALAIEGFRSAPLFGIGFDQFYTLVNPLLTDIEGKVMQDAHNIYLQMLCETGIVGTVLTLLPLLWLLVTAFRGLQAARKRPDRRGAEQLTVSLLIQSNLLFLGLLDPTFQKIVFWCFYGIAAMLLCSGLRLSGWQPRGPVTPLFEKTAWLLTALIKPLWRKNRK